MTDCIFLKRLKRPETVCELSSPMTEGTDDGLKLSVGLMENCCGLDEVPGC